MSKDRKPWEENVAEEMLRHMEARTAPWQKPWAAGETPGAAHNPTSKNPYRGMNAFWLDMQGRSDPRWMTYKQATSLGAQVRGGEKSCQIKYWKWTEKVPVLNNAGNPVYDDRGKPATKEVRLDRPRAFYASVFNAEQIDGLEPYKAPEPAFEPVAEAEKVLEAGDVNIKHDQNDRAYYIPDRDEIHLPDKAAFNSVYEYYATALHELGHATGHASRFGREFGPRGTEAYAKEELRAEMASYLVSRELGLGHYPERHASYVESWLAAIREDRNVLFQAARDAERIATWIRQPELRPELERTAHQNRQAKGTAQEQETAMTRGVVLYKTVFDHDKGQFDVQGLNADHQLQSKHSFATDYQAVAAWYIMTDRIQERSPSAVEVGVPDGERQEVNALLSSEQKQAIEVALASEWGERQQGGNEPSKNTRLYIAVPYAEKEQAKEAGARWDRRQKNWYVAEGHDLATIAKWLPENKPVADKAEVKDHDPVAEFADELKAAGVSLKEAPLMDGKWHRVSLDDDKKGERAASYRAFLDGRPNGHIKNFRSGETIRWVSQGETLSEEQRAAIKVEAARRQAERTAERKETQEKAAQVAASTWNKASPAPETTPYLDKKQVHNFGLKQDDKGNTLVPMNDVDGNLRSLQTITPDGQKRFLKGGQKTGLMYVIGGNDGPGKLRSQDKSVFIAESYSTAASVHDAVPGRPAVVAFDAGNLKPVARAIHKKYPTVEIVIAADNDHKLEGKRIDNVGLTKAREAARSVGGIVVAPVFNDKQKEKGLSDWNDLAREKSIKPELTRQLKQQRSVEKSADKPKARTAAQGR